jgi:hypothetical protein
MSDNEVPKKFPNGRPAPEPLGKAPLAYENAEFLDSADGRMLRIMAEYQEPLVRFRRERIADTVVFFGSARFRALNEAHTALELLENTGSTNPAPASEQPARPEEIESGEASELKLNLARSAVEMAHYYEDACALAKLVASWAAAASLRGDLGRRSGHHGGGQPRRV